MSQSHAVRGFTLIELMVVVAIVGILAAIAIPAFNDQVRKSRRSQAMEAIADLQLRQEQWRANNSAYGTMANIQGSATIPSGLYTLAFSAPGGNCASGTAASNANSFRITATAAGSQTADTNCATFVLTNLCGAVSKTSTPSTDGCWR